MPDAPKRYVYLLGYTYPLQSPYRTHFKTGNATFNRPAPVSTDEHVREAAGQLGDTLNAQNPTWNADFPRWRDNLVIVGCSLLRIEALHEGEWVLDAWQPWGPVPQLVAQETDRG